MTETPGVEVVGPSAASALVRSGAMLVDVRAPEEWSAGHVLAAINVPMRDIFSERARLPRDRRIVLGCANGNDSRLAALFLATRGYHVVSLEGGWRAWQVSCQLPQRSG